MKVYKGKIISVNKKNEIFSYLVTDGGKIVFVGNELPKEYANEEIIDLKNGALMPTFVDTHGHFSSYAMLATTVKLGDCKSNREILDVIAAADKNLPKKKTMLCFGATPKVIEGRLVNRHEIDSVVPDRNVVIICGDGHSAVMNTKAMNKMPKVVSQYNGFDGENGWFLHECFYKAVDKILSVVSAVDALQAFQGAIDQYISDGFGLICCESGTGFPLDLDIELVKWLYRGQDSGIQVRMFIQCYDIRKAQKRGINRMGGCFECALDGSITSSDAAFSEPYEGTDNCGIMYFTDEELYNAILPVHLAGMAYQMHAIGDKAVSQAARVYKRILDEYPRENHRHGIIHASFVPSEAMDIIEKYKIQIIGQPAFIELSIDNLDFMIGQIGEKRCLEGEPHNEFIRRGINFSASSDCPITFPNGIKWIHWMLNNPNEPHRLSLDDAIRVATFNGYYNTFDEDERGSLEVGKIADMIILDNSPYDVPKEDIKDIKVLSTILAGEKWENKKRKVLGVLLKGMITGKQKKL